MGYGQISFRGHHWEVHRLVWTLLRGPIPKGKSVLHNCPGGDNKLCCNPDHLWVGTVKDNALDAMSKGQMTGPPHMSGEQHPRRKLTWSKVIEIRHRQGETKASLGREFGVSAENIRAILAFETWRDGGYAEASAYISSQSGGRRDGAR